MDVEVAADELRIDGAPVDGAASVAATLGPPDRTITTDRTVAGLDDRSPLTVDIWDTRGVMAGDGWVAIAVGPNVLDESAWPQERLEGRVVIDGQDLSQATLTFDPLHGDRRHAELGRWRVTLVVDWDGSPGKLVVRRRDA